MSLHIQSCVAIQSCHLVMQLGEKLGVLGLMLQIFILMLQNHQETHKYESILKRNPACVTSLQALGPNSYLQAMLVRKSQSPVSQMIVDCKLQIRDLKWRSHMLMHRSQGWHLF